MHMDAAIILDKAEFAELVHEVVDARARRSNHRSQRLLAHLRGNRLRRAILAKIGE
mgnify:CR=1 FL=1